MLLATEKEPRPTATRASKKSALGGALAFALAGVVGCAPLPPGPAVQEVNESPAPRESLFSHPWNWTDEKGERVTFAHWAGQPLVVSAIFTQCHATCPRTIAKLLKVYDELRQQGRAAQFLVVTLDPTNDTPEVLQRFKTSSGFPESWHFLTGSTHDTRDLRDLLGIHVIDDGAHLLHDGRIMIFDESGIATRRYAGWALDDVAAL